MPQLTALVRNPSGAPTPPLIRVNETSMEYQRKSAAACSALKILQPIIGLESKSQIETLHRLATRSFPEIVFRAH